MENKFKVTMKKVWNFVKENKKVLIFAGTVTGATILLATLESNRIGKQIDALKDLPKENIPTFRTLEYQSEVGEIAESFVSDNEVEVLINCVKTEDLGKFGEELLNNIPELSPDTEVSMWVNAMALTKPKE